MKTLEKLAKADLMNQTGYEQGDFTVKFDSFWVSMEQKNTKCQSAVYCRVAIYDLTGDLESHHNYQMFTFGFVTPKGYKSSKVVPVSVCDEQNVTLEEIAKIKEFKSEYKLNTYDPFWYENEAKRRNAAAWNYIAANFITDPYCTR